MPPPTITEATPEVAKAKIGGASKRWSPEEEQQLRAEIEAGKSVDEIATAHNRTVGAIRARVSKLNLNK